MIWFTSDTHFGHANALAFCKRPWDDVDAMNDALVERINERVAPDDVLYHLGDFSFRATIEEAQEIRVAGAADDAAERDEITCDEMADLFERCADSYPVSERYLREVHDSPVKSGRNEREHMVIWFRANSTTGSGSFCRQKGNRSARTCYQRLQNAASLLWIAEAVGVDRATVERAFQAAVDKGDWRRGAGAIRSVIPWEAIQPLAAALLSPTDQGKEPTD